MKALGSKSLSAILAVIINILWWIEWIGGIIVMAVIIATAVSKQDVSLSVPVTFSTTTFKTVSPVSKTGPEGILQVMNGNFQFQINVNWQNTLLLLAGTVLLFAVIISITRQLKIIFSNLTQGRPFNHNNIACVRKIGILLIILSMLQWIFGIVLNMFLNAHFNWNNGTVLTYSFNVSYLITGVILIITSEIFKLGEVLEEEKQLTI